MQPGSPAVFFFPLQFVTGKPWLRRHTGGAGGTASIAGTLHSPRGMSQAPREESTGRASPGPPRAEPGQHRLTSIPISVSHAGPSTVPSLS